MSLCMYIKQDEVSWMSQATFFYLISGTFGFFVASDFCDNIFHINGYLLNFLLYDQQNHRNGKIISRLILRC